MLDHYHAVYRGGAFYPTGPCELPDDTEVTVYLSGQAPQMAPPSEDNPDERSRILERLMATWLGKPLAAGAPRLSRDELHERR